MNNKKIWTPNIKIEEAISLSNEYLYKCNSKQILTRKDFHCFNVYQTNKEWNLNGLSEVSHFFKFSKNDDPEKNRGREIVLKLLSSVLSSQYYFNPESNIVHEPYVFSIPDIFKTGHFNYGIIHCVELNNKFYNFIVSEWDMLISGSNVVKINPWNKFSQIVSSDHNEWFDFSRLKKIKSMDQHGYFSIKDWKSRNEYIKRINSINNVEDFKFGKILYLKPKLEHLNSYISYIEWATGIKKWFIPKGTDYISTINYIEELNKNNIDKI